MIGPVSAGADEAGEQERTKPGQSDWASSLGLSRCLTQESSRDPQQLDTRSLSRTAGG